MAFTCCSPDAREQLRVSRAIDLELVQWNRDAKREFKVLLAGTEEAGKSTFIKQMITIYGAKGYSERERTEFKMFIYCRVFTDIQILIKAMEALKISYENPMNKYKTDLLMVDAKKVTEITEECQRAIKSLWEDKGIQTCFDRRNEFQISDSAKFYFDQLDILCQPNYIPTIEDVLRARPPTTGIVEYTFQMEDESVEYMLQASILKNVVLKIVDIESQRSTRRKWLHCFEDARAIIVLIAIDDYDQVLFEDKTQNRLRKNLVLFENFISSWWLWEASIILFLTNTDLFQDKIQRSDLATHFPEYEGPPGDPEAAKQFLLQLFLSVNPDPLNKRICSHFIQTLDTENVQLVFKDIRETNLVQQMTNYGLS